MRLAATVFVLDGEDADRGDVDRTLTSLEDLRGRVEIDAVRAAEIDGSRLSQRWVTVLRAGERLLPEWGAALAAADGADVVYGDSSRLEDAVPRLRPAWSPSLWDRIPYFGAGAAVRGSLLAGRSLPAVDLLDYAVDHAGSIRHVAALVAADREPVPRATVRSRRDPAIPRTSLVIPTRDRLDLLRPCLDSVRRSTPEPHEVVIVDNESRDPETHRFLSECGATVVPYPGEFDFAAINNAAAREALGEVLVFLNNDTVVEHEGWLAALVRPALEPGVGAVGAMLTYPDGAIQHAGILVHAGARVDHLLSGTRPEAVAHPWALRFPHEVAAVTAACMAIRRELFLRVGGFDESLRVAFNDVDLCLRLRERGYRVLWTPEAHLTHHECATREATPPLADEILFRARWAGSALDGDPYLEPIRAEVGDALALPRGEYRRAEIDGERRSLTARDREGLAVARADATGVSRAWRG